MRHHDEVLEQAKASAPLFEERKITTEEAASCASEAIQHLNTIQPHGFMLVVDKQSLAVVQHSKNAFSMLSGKTMPAHSTNILGSHISHWLSLNTKELVALPTDKTEKLDDSKTAFESDTPWECIAHQTDNEYVLEFVPAVFPDYVNGPSLIKHMEHMIREMRGAGTTQKLYDAITSLFREYTGYDRAMLYRFLPDHSGEVISEAVSEREEVRFLKLRFPAEDIPEQARALYLKNKLRVMASVEDVPVKMIPTFLDDDRTLDMTHSFLRNMSEMHRTYLRNMGVNATMVMSIVIEDKLWGLLVFHHNEKLLPPNHVVYELKSSCELFADLLASYLSPTLNLEILNSVNRLQAKVQNTIQTYRDCEVTPTLYADALKEIATHLDYDFVGICDADECYVATPDGNLTLRKQTLQAIQGLFDSDDDVVQRHNLIEQCDTIDGLPTMAGIYAMRSVILPSFCAFFGREQSEKHVEWSGKPNTVNIKVVDNQRTLEPRSSFALWRQKVEGQCEFWKGQDEKLLSYFFESFKDLVQSKRNEMLMQQLEKSAFYDALTGLANRAYMRTFLNNLKSQSCHVTIFFIDLDNFKDVNDFLGHDAGDDLLITMATRLKASVRPQDMVARLGGDEFVIVFIDPEPPQSAVIERIARKIISALGEPVLYKNHTSVVTASIGVVSRHSNDLEIDDALKHADIAMYEAKNAGRNQFTVFNKNQQENVVKRAVMTTALRRVIASNQIQIAFQPQINTEKEVTGVEALARWHHEDMGWISPDTFIGIAEKTNMIYDLGLQIVEKSCNALAHWQRYAIHPSFETISINISPSQLMNQNFCKDMAAITHASGVDPKHVRLEITESVFMKSFQETSVVLKKLRDLGFSIALDDFGTGYSSLSYLWQLPIDEVKIDKSFVQSMTKDENLLTMVESIIDMCQRLNLEVVAEGVETSYEFSILKGLGCDTIQGYYFSKPISDQTCWQNFLSMRTKSALLPAKGVKARL